LAPVPPVAVLTEPKADKTAKRGARVAKGVSVKGRTNQSATAAKNAPKGKTVAVKVQETAAPRYGSKTAQVISVLQRKNGVTLPEIMEKMGWQGTPSAGSWRAQ
jgi:hypothetical protein